MTKLAKVISTAKKLIDLPYNSFSLDNYELVLKKHFAFNRLLTKKDNPIQLMSGNHLCSGIITNKFLKDVETIKGKKIYIVGKGLLFDSGGMDLKKEMCGMSDDKAGFIIALVVANYLKRNVIAYCPVTTNFIHTSKIIPGDIIKIGKKDVKITDTDAEGRLVLAEAISTLNVSKDDIIITIATLTGAVEYAIGKEATGVFSTNSNLMRPYAIASRNAKELAWGLPLWEHYDAKYKNEKPLKNWHREIKCGSTEAALFIKQFVSYPENWIHLDIASSAFAEDGKANGIPIKSLINFIKKIQ